MDLPAVPTLTPSPTIRGTRWRTSLLVILILSLAAGLRWHGITSRGFFFDELWDVEVSNGYGSIFFELPYDRVVDQVNPLLPANALPVWQIPAHTTGVTHPPGAFVSLRIWRDAFGDSMLSLRSWSAAWSLLTVALVFVAATQSFGRTAGAWAAALCALSLGSIDQAQDVRGYSMDQALALLAVSALLRMRGRTSAWPAAIAVGVVVGLMMFTHYFAAGACGAIALGAATMLRGRVRWQALGAIAVAAICWTIGWAPSMRAQLTYVQATVDVFLINDAARPIAATFARAIASPYQAIVADPNPWSPIVIGGGAFVWLLLGYRVIVRARSDDAAAMWLWLGIAVSTLGLLFAVDLARHTKHLEFPRYVVLANPALCVLLGSLPDRWNARRIVLITLAAAYCFTPWPPKPDLRPQLAFLQARAAPGDLVLLPARPDRPRDGQSRFLSLAYGLRWPRLRFAIPVGPQSMAWIDALPRDARWFCLSFAAYDPATWQGGLTVVERGPVSSGVAVFEVRRTSDR